MSLRELWPLLLVSDLERSLRFYVDLLEFQIVAEAHLLTGKRYWSRIQREGISLMLQQAETEDGPSEGYGRGVSFYIVCDDAAVIHHTLGERGVALSAPQKTEYGMLQVFVPEPDGYTLCFESLLSA